jgi:hypothetical protein
MGYSVFNFNNMPASNIKTTKIGKWKYNYFIALVVLCRGHGIIKNVPSGFIPNEIKEYFYAIIQTPRSLERTNDKGFQ